MFVINGKLATLFEASQKTGRVKLQGKKKFSFVRGFPLTAAEKILMLFCSTS
jgi:hypothetical protein